MSELKPLQRTLHLLCNANGRYLCGLVGGEIEWTAAPLQAVDAGMAWISSTEAADRLRKFRQLHPATPASLASLHLEAAAATPQDWRPVSVRTWGQLVAEELVG